MTKQRKKYDLYFDTEEHKKEAKEAIRDMVLNDDKETIAKVLYLLLDTTARQERMLATIYDQLDNMPYLPRQKGEEAKETTEMPNQLDESNEPEMVDLGLSVKWMKYNLGATGGDTAESWYGNYYAWAETSGKTDYKYSWNNYQYGNPPSKYNTTNHLTKLEACDDAATIEYGPNFRIPTKAELGELTGLQSEWVTDYQGISGLNGRLFHGTGDYSANTLFIPAAGSCGGGGRYGVGGSCSMWSASLGDDGVNFAWSLGFYGGYLFVVNDRRCYGFSVRGVSNKK